MTESQPGLAIATEGGVYRLTLDRPERRNALSADLIGQLDDALDRIAADGSARVVVLGAEGPVFCSGHDLEEMIGRSEEEYRGLFIACSRFMGRLRLLPVPVIARVQGPAVAAGCQLVAACDLAIAAEGATFSTPGVKIGLFCTTPMVPLVRSIPAKPAFEMLVTGGPITAARARELGLVNRVVPIDGLDPAVTELVGAILAVSPAAVRSGKAAFYDQMGLDEGEAYTLANENMTRDAAGRDAHEGITAFLEKRQPIWSSY